MIFHDYLFEIPTKCTSVRIYLTSDVFYCLCGPDEQQREGEIVHAHMALLRELAADRIEKTGFVPGMVTITAMDVEEA